ncbi:hypothetical protein QTO34_000233 [Cnephaeus nilssonii]|uniref:Lysosome-associated membrane glycoprotein 2-like transmembrane domain-containing protein n=1 Tax=Cnephaeus nilssonii TaxID=3371016 RepID=A0AA40LWC2_CNENI|nr:hypothetical protein QTO34_000233 [Eptesicus nilssonii]
MEGQVPADLWALVCPPPPESRRLNPPGDAVSMARCCRLGHSVGLWAAQWCLTEARGQACSLLAALADHFLCQPMGSPTGLCSPGGCSLAHPEEAMWVWGRLLTGPSIWAGSSLPPPLITICEVIGGGWAPAHTCLGLAPPAHLLHHPTRVRLSSGAHQASSASTAAHCQHCVADACHVPCGPLVVSAPEECSADSDLNFLIPVAVGVALGFLIIVVFISYMIGRRKSRTGYQSSQALPYLLSISRMFSCLASLAQWIERQPADQRVPGSIPVKGMHLGCRLLPGPGPGTGGNQSMRFSHIEVSLCLSLSLPLSLKINGKISSDGRPHIVTIWPPQDGQQGRAVVGNQACKGGQLGVIRPAGEQLGINRASRGVVRGRSGWQADAVRGNQAGRQVVRSQQSRIVRGSILERVQAGLRDTPPVHEFHAPGLQSYIIKS